MRCLQGKLLWLELHDVLLGVDDVQRTRELRYGWKLRVRHRIRGTGVPVQRRDDVHRPRAGADRWELFLQRWFWRAEL